jgi:hypothetical protein
MMKMVWAYVSGYQWKDLLAPANIPNWLLVIVGIVASRAAIKTLGRVKRQADLMNRQNAVAIAAAKAAEDSAKAALQQTSHMITSERAWLVIASVNDFSTFVWSGGAPLYWWRVRNVGNTPAILLFTQAVCRVVDSVSLDEIPQYPLPVPLSSRVLAPGDSIDFHTIWGDERGAWFRRNVEEVNPLILLSFGYIKYRTVLSEQICESRFCDAWFAEGNPTNHPTQPMEFKPWLPAPPEYTKHT